MARADFHSRLVGWLKVVLPLAALAILSTLFLLADRIDPTAAIPYAEVDVKDLVRDPRMTAPAYAGTTADGAGITLSATEARPASGEQAAAASGMVVLFAGSGVVEEVVGAALDGLVLALSGAEGCDLIEEVGSGVADGQSA